MTRDAAAESPLRRVWESKIRLTLEASEHWFRLRGRSRLGYQEVAGPPEEGGAIKVAEEVGEARQVGAGTWYTNIPNCFLSLFETSAFSGTCSKWSRILEIRLENDTEEWIPNPVSLLNLLHWTSHLNSQGLGFLICKNKRFGVVSVKTLPEWAFWLCLHQLKTWAKDSLPRPFWLDK